MTQHIPEDLANSKLLVFTITLPSGAKVKVDLKPDLDVDYDHLEGQLEDVPSQYMYWASLYSEMKAHVSLVERRIKVRRGVVTDQATAAQKDAGIKLTVDQIKSIVEQDETLDQLEVNLVTLQKQSGKLYHMLTAIQLKAENLRSLAPIKRQENTQSGRQS